MLPFAKVCVNYIIGDPLPNSIPVLALDPCSGEKFEALVQVHYPIKPLMCTGCKSLGHVVAACLITKRIWVKKTTNEAPESSNAIPTENISNVSHVIVNKRDSSGNNDETGSKEDQNEGWTKVQSKKKFVAEGMGSVAADITNVEEKTTAVAMEESPEHINIFKNLRNVDEIDLKRMEPVVDSIPQPLSKSQLKKRKAALRKSASPPSNFYDK